MLKYVLKRILLMVMVFLIIISMCFVLVKMLPNKPAEQFGKDMALIEMRREALGYNKPMIEQYGIFVRKTLLGGDWGISESLYLGQNVWDKFMEKMPATVIVNAYTMIFGVPLGLLFGIYAALKKNKWQDHFISTAVMIFVSVPSYVYAFLVQYFLCFKLRVFPFQMEAGYDYFSWKTFVSMVPAVLSLGFGTVAGLTRYTRAELTEVLTSDYLLLARTKGLSRAQTTVRHALRNAMIPTVIATSLMVTKMVGGAIMTETIFSWPGVGRMIYDSVSSLDYPVLQGTFLLLAITAVIVNIITDIILAWIDPRIKLGGKRA